LFPRWAGVPLSAVKVWRKKLPKDLNNSEAISSKKIMFRMQHMNKIDRIETIPSVA
jgi:hypothetical protein